jgi:hypothetical protein
MYFNMGCISCLFLEVVADLMEEYPAFQEMDIA